eukprot:scaffold9107_cov112-Isochrysis_galbana.AAC.5
MRSRGHPDERGSSGMQWAEGGDEAVGGFGYKLQTRARMIGHDGGIQKKERERRRGKRAFYNSGVPCLRSVSECQRGARRAIVWHGQVERAALGRRRRALDMAR